MPRRKGSQSTPQRVIDEIVEKHAQGKSGRELSEEYGKPVKTIKSMFEREARKKRNENVDMVPKQRSRKAAETLEEYQKENERLKMENELLRDFLYLAGRK